MLPPIKSPLTCCCHLSVPLAARTCPSAAEGEQLAGQRDALAQQLHEAHVAQHSLAGSAAQLQQERDQLLSIIDELSVQVASVPETLPLLPADAAAAPAGEAAAAAAAAEAAEAMERLRLQLVEREQQLEEAVQVRGGG